MSAEQPPTISGFVAPGFEGVRTAFEQNFERHGEVGATVSVVHRGTCVVDLVGGVSGESSDELYSSDMVQMVFSVTKGATAMCAHLLAERGLLDLDAPVASYWPEFAANGKSEIPVSWLLSHKSGLADVDRPDDYLLAGKGSMDLSGTLEWNMVHLDACGTLKQQHRQVVV